jgi:hypothetical protein
MMKAMITVSNLVFATLKAPSVIPIWKRPVMTPSASS